MIAFCDNNNDAFAASDACPARSRALPALDLLTSVYGFRDIGTGASPGGDVDDRLALGDFPAGGDIGTASLTVDKFVQFTVNQTTANQTLTLPTPTAAGTESSAIVANAGTTPFTMHGKVIPVNGSALFVWNTNTASWLDPPAWMVPLELAPVASGMLCTVDQIDAYDRFHVETGGEDPSGLVFTLPIPTANQSGKLVRVCNVGVDSFKIYGVVLQDGFNASNPAFTEFFWNGNRWVTAAVAPVPFGGSGASHLAGSVPDPGAVAGTSRFLNENGGWVVPSGGLTFATRALASAQDYTAIDDQSPVRTGTRAGGNFAYWFLDKTATDAVDGITFLAANIPATPGVGRLVRQFVALPGWVRKQLIYIDNATGDNEGSGDVGSKIKASLEWFMRGMGYFQFFQSLTLSGSQVWPATDRFHYSVTSIEPTASSNATFAITGQRFTSRAGSCTANSTNPVATLGAEQMATITDAAVADWTADVDKLIVAANGAFAWVQKNLGGGVARVGPWQTLGGGTAAAPPNGTAYTVVSLTSMTVLPVITGAFDTYQVINIDLGTSLRSLSGKTQWLGCKFNFGNDMVLQGTFATCHFTGGVTFNFSNNGGVGEISPTQCIFGGCTFRNVDVTWSTGLLEFADCFFQGQAGGLGHVLAGRPPNGHSGVVGCATMVVSGTYGMGLFDAGAANPALVVDGSSRLFVGEALFGNGALGGGTKLRRETGVFLKGIIPTLRCAAGVELSVPPDPVGPRGQAGVGTLVGGVATIAATSVTAQSRIVVTRDTPAGVLGAGGLIVPDGTVVPGVGFDVKAIDLAGGLVNTETSTFNWVVVQSTADCTTWANYAANFPNGMTTTKENCFIQGP